MTPQLDYIIGPSGRDDDVCICHDVRTWAVGLKKTRIQEEVETVNFPKKKEKEELDKMENKDRRAKT